MRGNGSFPGEDVQFAVENILDSLISEAKMDEGEKSGFNFL